MLGDWRRRQAEGLFCPAGAHASRCWRAQCARSRAGRYLTAIISRQTAEAAEHLIFDFLLPHTFALYDVVANGGQDRDTIRAIGDFILASDKDRFRPSDFRAGVRRLRSEPTNKIADWASRFIAWAGSARRMKSHDAEGVAR